MTILLVRDDCVIRAPDAARRLLDQSRALQRSGTVTAMDAGGVELSDGARISAGVTVCAAGIRTSALVPGVGMQPLEGHPAITGRSPGFVRHQLVELGYLKSAHRSAVESVAF